LPDLLAASNLRSPESAARYQALLAALWPEDLSSISGSYDLGRAAGELRQRAARDGDRVRLKTVVWPSPGAGVGAGELDQHGRLAEVLEGLDVPGAQKTVTGEVLLFERHNRALLSDLVPVTATAALAVAALVFLFFRRWAPVALVLLPPFAAISCTLALATCLELPVPPAAICFLAIVLGVGVDDGIFLLTEVLRGKETWVAARELGPVLLLTSVSTACGFGALGIAHHAAIASLGTIVAVGVLLCWLATLVLLAPLTSWLNERGWLRGRNREGCDA
ncbi:MAG: MMPL family transporter, partial [Thermoanaerobaculia bacterium]|nr:MMPL family transporter [Thermoanaerobaculia bacterium]